MTICQAQNLPVRLRWLCYFLDVVVKNTSKTKAILIVSDNLARRLGAEEVLETIFTQVLAFGAFQIPAGVTNADLRAALALAPSLQRRIYNQAKLRFGPKVRSYEPSAAGFRMKWLAQAALALAFTAIFIIAWMLPRVVAPAAQPIIVSAPHLTEKPRVFSLSPCPVTESVTKLLSLAMHDPAALAVLQSRAATGNADAAYALATLFDSHRTRTEITLPKNDKAAFGLYKQAAEAGNALAELATGLAYQTGRGVTPDAVLATAWFRAAALDGLARAQKSLRLAGQNGGNILQGRHSTKFPVS